MALLFFDIDGTIWDYDNVIPESTKTTMRLLRENGHRIFICSGRTKVFLICPELSAMNFDGIVGGCGTEIEYRGKELLLKNIDHDLLLSTVQLLYSYDIPVVLEARNILFMDADMISRDEFGKWIVETRGDITRPIRGNYENLEASKYTALINRKDYKEIVGILEKDYEVMIHGKYVLEAAPKGYSKATGIALVRNYLGVSREEIYAFGDGANDVEMLDYAGVGVVMGNETDLAKEHADYVTSDIHEDGIYKACRHFGLI